MRSKNIDLRNYLFSLLDELEDRENCTPDTIERARAAAGIAKAINDSAKNDLKYLELKLRDQGAELGHSGFLGEG